MSHYKHPYKPTSIVENNKDFFRGSPGCDNLGSPQELYGRHVHGDSFADGILIEGVGGGNGSDQLFENMRI